MKIVKRIVAVFLCLFVVFFILGFVKKEIHYGHTIEVSKSVQEAWAVSEDESKMAQWIDGLESETLISGENGKAGSVYKVVVKPSAEEDAFEMTETIVDVKENEFITMQFDSDVMVFDQTMSFSPKNNGASIQTISVVKGKGILMRSIFAVMEIFGGSFQKQEELNINKLKKLIEENTTDYFPEDPK